MHRLIVLLLLLTATVGFGLFGWGIIRDTVPIIPPGEQPPSEEAYNPGDFFRDLAQQLVPLPPPTPVPTPRPLTFAEMSALYGPCAIVPVLTYHHVQPEETAQQRGQQALTVYTPTFIAHLQYLKDRNYRVISPQQLIEFFDGGLALPPNPVLITFDDGYDDFASDAAPALRKANLGATLFLSTGLADNPGYVSWKQLAEAVEGSQIKVGNHTWSHHNLQARRDTIAYEVGTAQQQLSERGYGDPKTFAYPYGLTSAAGIDYLSNEGYQLAFTTEPGKILCKQRRLLLPRVRVGNAPLSAYGL